MPGLERELPVYALLALLRADADYAMRHTFASFAIAAGVSLFYSHEIMGTSIEQIDRTYGHLLPDSEEFLRRLLDTFDAGQSELSSGGVV